jgi:hypothetical protein
MTAKEAVRDFWNEASCGERLLLPSIDIGGFDIQRQEIYRLEPYTAPFADFCRRRGS